MLAGNCLLRGNAGCCYCSRLRQTHYRRVQSAGQIQTPLLFSVKCQEIIAV